MKTSTSPSEERSQLSELLDEHKALCEPITDVFSRFPVDNVALNKNAVARYALSKCIKEAYAGSAVYMRMKAVEAPHVR